MSMGLLPLQPVSLYCLRQTVHGHNRAAAWHRAAEAERKTREGERERVGWRREGGAQCW